MRDPSAVWVCVLRFTRLERSPGEGGACERSSTHLARKILPVCERATSVVTSQQDSEGGRQTSVQLAQVLREPPASGSSRERWSVLRSIQLFHRRFSEPWMNVLRSWWF